MLLGPLSSCICLCLLHPLRHTTLLSLDLWLLTAFSLPFASIKGFMPLSSDVKLSKRSDWPGMDLVHRRPWEWGPVIGNAN